MCDSADQYKTARDRGSIKGVSSSAALLIEQQQPYRNTQDVRMHPLWLLREMDNAYKHRLLAIISAAATPHTILLGDGKEEMGPGQVTRNIEIIGLSPPAWPVAVTDAGAELLRVQFGEGYDPTLKVEAKVSVDVAFEDFGALALQSVVGRLRELKNKTTLMIGLFSSEFGS